MDAYEAHMICQFGVMVADDSGVERNELYVSWFKGDMTRQEEIAFMDARSTEFLEVEQSGYIEKRGAAQYQSATELYRTWFVYTAYGKMMLHMMRQLDA